MPAEPTAPEPGTPPTAPTGAGPEGSGSDPAGADPRGTGPGTEGSDPVPEVPLTAGTSVPTTTAHAPVSAGMTQSPGRTPGPRFGVPGMPMSRSSPFYLGFVGALGVLLAMFLTQTIALLASIFVLIAVSLFLALSLHPLVEALQRRGLPRRGAVAVVVLGVLVSFAGFITVISQPLVEQGTELVQATPDLLQRVGESRLFRQLDQDYGIVSRASDEIEKRLASGETVLQVFGGILGAGRALVSGVFSTFTVLVLTLYFLASLHSMTDTGYRLVPASRRERVRLIGDEIIRRIGGYVAGQLGVATVNALCTFVLVSVLRLPYAVVLSITVGVLGLIPMVGAILGAVVVVLVALFQSWQMAVGVAIYYVIYQQVENYLVMPRIMSRTVAVPGSVTVIAALAGGALLGLLGALIAIPIAAGILLIVNEVVIPRQDRL